MKYLAFISVLVTTVTMNDITLSPTKLAKSGKDYIDEHYPLEWLAVKTHFTWGNVAFIIGSALRAWLKIVCPVVGKGILGILSSLTLVSISLLIEKDREQTGRTILESTTHSINLIKNKMKTNVLFGIAMATYIVTIGYITSRIPHIYHYLAR